MPLRRADGAPVWVLLGLNAGRRHGSLRGRARIFERFERAASARHYGGFGLGLWITRQIVAASGGTVAVESEPGRGSTFVVDLPLNP